MKKPIECAEGCEDQISETECNCTSCAKYPEVQEKDTFGNMMDRKLRTYISVTNCLSNHLGMNPAYTFANCSGCGNDALCAALRLPLNENYRRSKENWRKMHP